ncbi:MAG: hypothetical protein ACKOA2_01880 [Ilumatobacteraceae bacterium]
MKMKNPVRKAAALAVVAACVAISPGSAGAYARRTSPDILTAQCTGGGVGFTWDTNAGKPTKFLVEQVSGSYAYESRLSKAELTDGSVFYFLGCFLGEWRVTLTNRAGSDSITFGTP